MSTIPADLPPGVVLARVGKGPGGMLAVRVVGAVLVRREDGLYEFPADWTRALVKATAPTGMIAYEVEPDPAGRETLTSLGFWLAGAFKVTATITDRFAAAEAWSAMGRQDGKNGP